MSSCCLIFVFFFNDTATTEIYTLSLHDALPISGAGGTGGPARHQRADQRGHPGRVDARPALEQPGHRPGGPPRSEEHTSELQSRQYLVCRLLLEKKKNTNYNIIYNRTANCIIKL